MGIDSIHTYCPPEGMYVDDSNGSIRGSFGNAVFIPDEEFQVASKIAVAEHLCGDANEQ